MPRVAFKMRLKPGCEAIYQEQHDAIWPELADLIRRQGIRNYSIFQLGLDLFAYYESDEPAPSGTAGDEIDPVQRAWWRMMEPYMEYNEDHTPKIWPMTEMFHQD